MHRRISGLPPITIDLLSCGTMDNKPNLVYGRGRKRPLCDVRVSRLHLDPENPRLSDIAHDTAEIDIIRLMYQSFDLETLARSIAENGYFDEEPLVAIPSVLPQQFSSRNYEELKNNQEYLEFVNDEATELTVVEGNRRLACVKSLLSDSIRRNAGITLFPLIDEDVRRDIEVLPVIVYPSRQEVLPYLGVRHIAGVKKWEPFAKARYIAYMRDQGTTLDQIQKIVADSTNSIYRYFVAYKIVQLIEEHFDIDTSNAKQEFSYLLLALGQGSIKQYIGLPSSLKQVDLESPISNERLPHLRHLFSWLYGEGKGVRSVLNESRDITQQLAKVVSHPVAVQNLIETRDLAGSFQRAYDEQEQALTILRRIERDLEKALPIVNLAKDEDSILKDLLFRLKRHFDALFAIIGG